MSESGQFEGLSYEISGSGPPIVFIAGCGADPICWALARRALEADFRILTFDSRGLPGPVSSQTLADSTSHLLEHLSIPPALVVGHSLGGMVAQHLSLNHPERVRALVLVASCARLGERAKHILDCLYRALALDPMLYLDLLMPWAFSAKFFRSAKNLHFIREGFVKPPLESFGAQMRAVFDHDSRSVLKKITVPTMVVAGEEDLICDAPATVELSEGIRGSRVEIIPGGHACYMEQAELFNGLVRRFSGTSAIRLGVRQT